jgi:hypothetical protein
MTMLELKGEMHEWIAGVQDKNLVHQLHAVLKNFVKTHADPNFDFEQNMTSEQETAVRRAIERSAVESNFVAEEVAEKRFDKWLKN